MYHFVAQQAPNLVQISEKIKIPGHIRQYFKNFQIDAIRFLLPRLIKHEFSVFNDESGLGKSAVVSVLLGAVALYKKCLIVVNDDDCVMSWQFHLDVLTNLSVMLIKSDKDFTDNVYNVYIAKWNTLRSIDLSKFKFDYIVIDNRGEMLNNSFCTSMLIKNYERKVDIIISSIDITSDVRLLYSILRLGGLLENKYQSYSVFENHFKLPALNDLSSRKIKLEEYYVKREILSNYCKDFRLRRFCYEFKDDLPLVKGDRHKISLGLWRTATNINETQSSSETVNNIAMSLEKIKPNGAVTKLLDNSKVINVQDKNKLKLVIDNVEKNEEESPLMSPLLLLSDSDVESLIEEIVVNCEKSDLVCSDKQPEIVDLSSNDAISVDTKVTGYIRAENPKTKPVKVHVRNINSNEKNNITKKEVQKCMKPPTVSNVKDNVKNIRTKCTTSAEKPLLTRERKTVKRKDSETSMKADKRTANRNKSTITVQKTCPEKRKKINSSDKNETELKKIKRLEQTPKPSKSVTTEVQSNDNPINKKSPTIKTPKTPKTRRRSIVLRNVEWKATRRMSRLTRHALQSANNKYLRNNLTLIIDPKTDPDVLRKPTKLKKNIKTKLNKEETKEKKGSESTKEFKVNIKVCKNNTDTKRNREKLINKKNEHKKQVKKNTNYSSELPLVSLCSEYEDMQCAQGPPSSFNSQRIRTEFLVPPTPPAYMAALANLPSASLTDNDIIYVSTKQNVNNKNQDIIVLSSSQESSQSNQSRRTIALKQKKALRPSKIKEEIRTTFVDVFDKYIERNKEQSPDLFSNCSDLPITCTQANKNIPFDGFKIFGSEVKQLQQQTALLDKKRKVQSRSCLDLLENMFDPNLKKNVLKTLATTRKDTATPPILPAHPIAAITNLQNKQELNTIKNSKNNKAAKKSNNIVNDDIFEITTNDIFGSTMRITANGDVSPIRTKSPSTHNNNHNKITNYLIGNTYLTPVDDETNINASNKRTQILGPNKTRSPKSKTTQTTQTTKLTKWFHKKNLSDVGKAAGISTRTVNPIQPKTPSSISVITTPKTRTKTSEENIKQFKRRSENIKEPRRSKRLDFTV
ncbi:protein suppressor of underreplication [Teleopsis dalmanni]|uniref:protein suppressor of underreplication n=1 Tax=Teleopsis dalmanni TaxID=139649 RepID=UPI0018CC8B3A|nr:protein suppressor of underreplication [Teleopsis dalmanni]